MAPGGRGGRATATLRVTPGAVVTLMVGGAGVDPGPCYAAFGAGGFNGGGDGGVANCNGAGGGGASDVRVGGTALSHRVLVAGGGGGAARPNAECSTGGSGGGFTGGTAGRTGGENCVTEQAEGGNQNGTSDSRRLGVGSNGTQTSAGLGGGGGGGYYGGAGGSSYIGGGGGSGFGPLGVAFANGVRSGNGLVTITPTATVDSTPPTVSAAFTPSGQNGWFTNATASGNATADDTMSGGSSITSFGCSGPGVSPGTPSGLDTPTANLPLSVTGEGSHAVSCSATDSTGNTGMGDATVKIDSVAPTVQRNMAADSCSRADASSGRAGRMRAITRRGERHGIRIRPYLAEPLGRAG